MSKKPFGRLAFRAEGVWWNCYLARMDTMDEAIPVGSMLLRVSQERTDIRNAFMEVMKEAFEYMLAQIDGREVEKWGDETPAPEKDRTKPS